MPRRFVGCDNCDKTGNFYYNDTYRAALCDGCLSLPPAKQRAIISSGGQIELEKAIISNFNKIFGESRVEDNMNVKFSYDGFDKISNRLDELKKEYDNRSGKALSILRERHRNKKAAVMKIQLQLEQLQIEAREATENYEAEKLAVEKLEITIDDLSIQKKVLYKKPENETSICE